MAARSIHLNNVRRNDLDNLRTFLTGLVIVHHTSNCYGGPGGGPYKSALIATINPSSRLPLFIFNAINHSFFMGLFLWISGRVSSQSLKRIDADPYQTRRLFVRSKLLRLGLPALFYTLVLEPLSLLVGQQGWGTSSMKETLQVYYAGLDGIRGPVWYTANLLLLDIIASLICCSTSQRQTPSAGEDETKDKGRHINPPRLYILARRYGWILATLASFLIRIYYPVGTTIKPIALQVAFAPQYAFAYTMGFTSANVEQTFTGPFPAPLISGAALHAPRRIKDNSQAANSFQEYLGIVEAIMLSIVLVPLPHIPRMFGNSDTSLLALGSTGIHGGWNSASFLYSFWNEISFVLIGPAVASSFYQLYNSPTKSQLFRPRDSYAAFLVHMPVSGLVERGLDCFLLYDHPALVGLLGSSAWQACAPTAMTGIVGTVNVVASFAVARFVLDTVPILRTVF